VVSSSLKDEEDEDVGGLLGMPDGESQYPFTVLLPTPVPSVADVRFRAVAADVRCSLAVSDSGQVFMWGPGKRGRLACDQDIRLVPTVIEQLRGKVRQVAVGFSHCAAVTEDGKLFTWSTAELQCQHGRQPAPGLGYFEYARRSNVGTPQCVVALAGAPITSVSAGMDSTFVVTAMGAVYSFGDGSTKSLGHGDSQDTILLPKRIARLDGICVVTVSVRGGHHCLALTNRGRVYSWGFGCSGELGLGDVRESTFPRLMEALCLCGERVCNIATDLSISCAVTLAGRLYTWGAAGFGVLGHGDEDEQRILKLVEALRGIKLVGVTTSGMSTLAVSADGGVFGWGHAAALGLGWGAAGDMFDEVAGERCVLMIGDLGVMLKPAALQTGRWERLNSRDLTYFLLSPRRIPGLVCTPR